MSDRSILKRKNLHFGLLCILIALYCPVHWLWTKKLINPPFASWSVWVNFAVLQRLKLHLLIMSYTRISGRIGCNQSFADAGIDESRGRRQRLHLYFEKVQAKQKKQKKKIYMHSIILIILIHYTGSLLIPCTERSRVMMPWEMIDLVFLFPVTVFFSGCGWDVWLCLAAVDIRWGLCHGCTVCWWLTSLIMTPSCLPTWSAPFKNNNNNNKIKKRCDLSAAETTCRKSGCC